VSFTVNQTSLPQQPDVSQLRSADFPSRPFPGKLGQAFRVFLEPAVRDRIWQHARETLSIEICGILVGSWGKDNDGPFVIVSESIRGEAATSKFAEVTFTHETWAKINQEMDTKFAHLAIVGWYHTHPDFGVFLSDRDVFIQQHFFSGPGQIAYVIDPVRQTEGAFVWKQGKPSLAPYIWVGERLLTASPPQDHQPPASQADADAGKLEAMPSASWPVWLIHGLAYLCLFLLGFFLATRMSTSERSRLEEDAVARSAFLLGIRPGLREALDRCLADLRAAEQQARELTRQSPEAPQEKLGGLREALDKSQARLKELQTRYCLTPAESDRMIEYAAAVLAMSTEGLTRKEREELAQRVEAWLKQGAKQGLYNLPENAGSGSPKSEAPAPPPPSKNP
jgi:proteasome lid subunit RPN8/RPN11